MVVMAILGGLHWAKGHSGQLAVAIIINIAITAQQLGGGAPTYTLTNEISSLRLRAKTQSFALTVNFVLNWAYNLFVPKVREDPLEFGGITSLYPIRAQALHSRRSQSRRLYGLHLCRLDRSLYGRCLFCRPGNERSQ